MKSLDEAYGRARARFNDHEFAQLDDVDKILVTIWELEAEVNNGGFDQYYFNDSGDQAFYASEALESIAAHRMADIVSSANKLFGPDGPSRDRQTRQLQLFLIAPANNGMPSPWEQFDRAFYAYPDDIAILLAAYLRATGRLAT